MVLWTRTLTPKASPLGQWTDKAWQAFLTIPALIYQTMTPLFPRSRKFGNPYAFATIDGVFTVLWFSAFVSVAVWNSAGRCGDGCRLSKADVGLGFFMLYVHLLPISCEILTRILRSLLFGVTTFMSLYGVFYFRRTGNLPGAAQTGFQNIDPDAEAFSTAPNEDEYAPVGLHDHDPKDDHHEEDYRYGTHNAGGTSAYAPNYGNAPEYHHTAPLGMNPTTSYGGAASERIHFPAGNYD
jgi:hypothetical protein